PNGGQLDAQVADAWAATLPRFLEDGEVVVPPGQYFCMGDNRDDSLDSRYWGFVPQANLIGRPSLIYWSYRSTENDYEAQGLASRFGGLVLELLNAPLRTRWLRTFHVPR
ncbi:MAG: signal peptidase I, partial [Terriglobales bacterium]